MPPFTMNQLAAFVAVAEAGTISREDLALFRYVETADEADALLRAELVEGDVVLLKSSNVSGLMALAERIGAA